MEPIITSAGNSTVKELRKLLKSSKARRDAATYVAEGIHLVKSFLLSNQTPKIYVRAESAGHNKEVAELIDELESKGIKGVVLADTLFEAVTNIHAPVGLLVVFTPPRPTQPVSLSASAVLLEAVQDPGNLGTILRTAAAVGVREIYLSSECTSPWSPKTLRAGMGAQFGLQIYEGVELTRTVKAATVPVFATTLATDSTSLFTLDLTGPAVWLFGNEGQGISSSLAGLATARVSIPQAEGTVESLNVSAAAAVCLYEHYRQHSLALS